MEEDFLIFIEDLVLLQVDVCLLMQHSFQFTNLQEINLELMMINIILIYLD
jgi:hypothetical protein